MAARVVAHPNRAGAEVSELCHRYGLPWQLGWMLVEDFGYVEADKRCNDAAVKARDRLRRLTGQDFRSYLQDNLLRLTAAADGITAGLMSVESLHERRIHRGGFGLVSAEAQTADWRMNLSPEAERDLLAREYGSLSR